MLEDVSKIKTQLWELADVAKGDLIQAWQIDEIKKGIEEADAGLLISHDEVIEFILGSKKF